MFDMINTVLRNFFSKPATRQYPQMQRKIFKDTRGQVRGMDISKCIFCGICQRKCPSNAIRVNKIDKSWELDRFKCAVCAECSESCPKKCIYMDEDHAVPLYQKRVVRYSNESK